MLHQLRWQIGLALAGLAAIGLLVIVFAHRGFTDVPSRGGVIVEAVVGQPAVFNPLLATNDAERDIAALLFCGLTAPDGGSQPGPDLATEWSISDDGLAYTFVLRRDALFHDGLPVTADDVVFTANMAAAIARDAALAIAASPTVRPWERVTAEKVDDSTVVLRLTEPYAPFLEATTLGILPEHVLRDVRPSELVGHRFTRVEPIGCGPYRLPPDGYDGESARLVRHDEHWAATDIRPYLDAIQFRFYPTVDAALEELGKHGVQAMGGVPPRLVPDLGDDAREYSAVQPGFGLVYLNNDSVLFSEAAVRRALSNATDRTAIATDPSLLGGQGQASASPIPTGSWAYWPDHDRIAFDPAAARSLLEQEGWIDGDGDGIRDRDGKPLRFRLGTSSEPVMQAIAEKLALDWRTIGADPQIETLDQQATMRSLSARDFDAMLFSWELPQYDPDPYPLWHSSQVTEGQNYAAFRNDAADQAMVDARLLPPSAANLDARAQMLRTFQQIFAEEVPSIVLYHPVYSYVVVDPSFGGVQLPPLVVHGSDRFLTLSDWFTLTERVFRQETRP